MSEPSEAAPAESPSDFGPNDWMVEDMYRRFADAPESVSEAWRDFFADYVPNTSRQRPDRSNGRTQATGRPTPTAETVVAPAGTEPASPRSPTSESEGADTEQHAANVSEPPEGADRLIGITARIAEAMDTSLEVPTATSVRSIPAKLLEVNRRILNNHLRRSSHGGKVSFTHLIGWAVVKAMNAMPELNVSYDVFDGVPYRVHHGEVNLGLAVDQEGRDGNRVLIVPNIKGVQSFDFEGYWSAYEALIRKVRRGELGLDDFAGTTVTLTNPGMIGTVQSVPRLMKGQGLIVGVGAIIYPPEYQAADAATLARLGIGRVMTLTSTYDHRVIQGAQSGRLLDLIHGFLLGEDAFYDEIFEAMHVPYTPARWAVDDNPQFGTPAWAEKQARVFELINRYRVRGHLIADLDPLRQQLPAMPKELDPLTHGLTIWDLDREYATNGIAGKTTLKLGEILGILRDAYCRTTGIEYMHMQDPDEKQWLRDRLERPPPATSRDEKVRILRRLNQAESFEEFLHTKYVGHKRFGLEGLESLIPLMATVLDQAADDGMEEVVIGMAHRGRLNVLANIVGKDRSRIFREFEGDVDPDTTQGSGDVKYHLGAQGAHQSPAGNEVAVEVVPNPSHLEAVDPVLVGVARAKMEAYGSDGHDTVLPMLLHGDAAFAGQGVVVETLNLSQLRGYRTGGTVHVILNNQVGFTTSVADARSSVYATDVAKTIMAPILHVNADDPEAVVRAARLAYEYRAEFHKDVVIDMIGYRRRGHNEGDEPSFTQPLMYRAIDAHRSVRKQYMERLINQGDLSIEDGDAILEDYRVLLQSSFEGESRADGESAGGAPEANVAEGGQTSVAPDLLADLNAYVNTPPDGFTVHPKLERVLDGRRKLFADGMVDWAMAEYFALGALAEEGFWVRWAGEDSKRGTFSHRHAALVDFETGEQWLPLQERTAESARVRFVDSLLSEFAAVGFEYGYSIESPDTLVVWEAQFGDFANGAQVVIDQFVAAGEAKWGVRSSLVLMLPHGFEGQGPEHSSARLERYLQLAAGDNLRIVVPSTPAQLFHALRRQMHTRPRKPLVLLSPKSLLRTSPSFSPVGAFTDDGFRSVIDDPARPDPESVTRLVVCSGKIYYDVDRERGPADDGVALVRLEEPYPFPTEELERVLSGYRRVSEIVWLQEEPENMGAWPFVRPLLANVVDQPVEVICRGASASPATGSNKRHAIQQQKLVDRALGR